ncbi:MAG: hypothetical protein CMA00_003410 [Methanobacteriota archaeon]|nr:MAG: hypothetical protein CMA00_003410 [Euryarchaeota archaeon]|tara:strand:+ start:38311 stop:39240 length:930 start_codon:yes stop_codon:yes gene_type:complete
MVDVDTALRASAYSGKKGSGGSKGGDGKGSKIEPFEPAIHAEKERADAISMWIVIVFGLSVAALMRFYMMPNMEGTQQALWLLPFLMIALIRPIHQILVPSKFFSVYTTGNWVRASFLYLFTWLALSFALVNPPLADIASPHLADAIDIADSEGMSMTKLSGDVYEVRISQDSIPVLMALAVRDNVDAENSTMNLTIQKVGQMEPIVSVFGSVSEIAAAGPGDAFESVEPEDWRRGLRKNSLTNEYVGPKVAPHPQDVAMAWDLCPDGCGPGEYIVKVELYEEGDMIPWSTSRNSWSADFTISILQSSS